MLVLLGINTIFSIDFLKNSMNFLRNSMDSLRNSMDFLSVILCSPVEAMCGSVAAPMKVASA